MRNPLHKRLEKFKTWQHQCFMLCLCQRMLPNFVLFAQVVAKEHHAKFLQNLTALLWEYLTVKHAQINFDRQLEKLESIIPASDEYEYYGVFPAIDSTQAFSELIHSIIGGEHLEHSIAVSQVSLNSIKDFIELHEGRALSESELKNHEMIQGELDAQWYYYRQLNQGGEFDLNLVKSLRDEVNADRRSNIGISLED